MTASLEQLVTNAALRVPELSVLVFLVVAFLRALATRDERLEGAIARRDDALGKTLDANTRALTRTEETLERTEHVLRDLEQELRTEREVRKQLRERRLASAAAGGATE